MNPDPNPFPIFIRFLEPGDAAGLLKLYISNRTFLKPWDPERSAAFFTTEGQREILNGLLLLRQAEQNYVFGIFLTATGELIGRIALSNIVRGSFLSAALGYFMDESYNGRGCTTAAIKLTLNFAFKEINLHRVQAAVLPYNGASIRVLQKNGFRYEGLAQRYLKISGAWQDHLIYAITSEEFPAL